MFQALVEDCDGVLCLDRRRRGLLSQLLLAGASKSARPGWVLLRRDLYR